AVSRRDRVGGHHPVLLGKAQGSIAKQLDQTVGDLRIELLAGLVEELAFRLLEAQRLPIGPRRRHRVQGVSGADDAARQWDGLTGQAVGIAPTVPALVVVADPDGDLRQTEGKHRSLARLAVALDEYQ